MLGNYIPKNKCLYHVQGIRSDFYNLERISNEKGFTCTYIFIIFKMCWHQTFLLINGPRWILGCSIFLFLTYGIVNWRQIIPYYIEFRIYSTIIDRGNNYISLSFFFESSFGESSILQIMLYMNSECPIFGIFILCIYFCGYLRIQLFKFYIFCPSLVTLSRYLRLQVSPTNKAICDYHFFNTFFYKKLEQAVTYTVSFLLGI